MTSNSHSEIITSGREMLTRDKHLMFSKCHPRCKVQLPLGLPQGKVKEKCLLRIGLPTSLAVFLVMAVHWRVEGRILTWGVCVLFAVQVTEFLNPKYKWSSINDYFIGIRISMAKVVK